MNPTQEQMQWFWEQCGLRWFWNHNPDCDCGALDDNDDMRDWNYQKDGKWVLATNFYHEKMNRIERPEFIGYLFKYAVPKLAGEEEIQCLLIYSAEFKWEASLYKELSLASCSDEDPAIALFWAIYKAFGGKE